MNRSSSFGLLIALALTGFNAPAQSEAGRQTATAGFDLQGLGSSIQAGGTGVQLFAYQSPDPEEDDEQPADNSDQEGSYDVFYDRLGQDGRWYYDDDYGYVFQPSTAVEASDWRPYADGHWVWTDRGWYWVSNERFGWACYHYGRWIRIIGIGWVWIPGSTWAPAWVSWRQGDDDIGWAPLPPECEDSPSVRISSWCDRYYDIGPEAFCFIAFRNWNRPNYGPYLAPPQNNVTIINRTTNITNVVYNNQVVNNFGPQPQLLSRQLGQPVQQYRVNYVANPQPQNGFGTTVHGNQLQVLAPPAQLRRAASVQPPVQSRLAKAQVDRGWQHVNPAQATEYRAQLAKEPPPPASLPPKPALPPKVQAAGGPAATPARPGQPPGPAQPKPPANSAAGHAGQPPELKSAQPGQPAGVQPGRQTGQPGAAQNPKPGEGPAKQKAPGPNANATPKTPAVPVHSQQQGATTPAAVRQNEAHKPETPHEERHQTAPAKANEHPEAVHTGGSSGNHQPAHASTPRPESHEPTHAAAPPVHQQPTHATEAVHAGPPPHAPPQPSGAEHRQPAGPPAKAGAGEAHPAHPSGEHGHDDKKKHE